MRALFWRLIVRYEIALVIEREHPAHVREILGKDRLKTWAHECSLQRTGHEVKTFRLCWQNGLAFLSLLDQAIQFIHYEGGGDMDGGASWTQMASLCF